MISELPSEAAQDQVSGAPDEKGALQKFSACARFRILDFALLVPWNCFMLVVRYGAERLHDR